MNLSLLERGIQLVEEVRGFDLIHCHDWLGAYCARALKHAYRIPMLATIHATEYGRQQGLHTDWQRYISDVEWWLTYEAWRVVCCSEYMRTEVMSVFQLPADKVRVIKNGVDPAAFQAASNRRREEFAGAGEQIVFFVGRLVPEKGVQVLLDAVPEVLKVRPAAKFLIAGTGPSEPWLKAKARQLNIANRVAFLGYIDDDLRNSLYSWADAAVFPSTYEPFGLVALEAMAAKCPVVVADTGGLSETVEHGIDGLKCRPGDARSLAGEILHLLCDREYAKYLKENAYRKIVERYSWDEVAAMTANVYAEVLAEYKRGTWRRDTLKSWLGKPFIFSGLDGGFAGRSQETGRYTTS